MTVEQLTARQRQVLRNAAIVHPSGSIRSSRATCEQLVKKGLMVRNGDHGFTITKAGLDLHASIKRGE